MPRSHMNDQQTFVPQVQMVQLHNPKTVPAEWAFKKPPEAPKAKDWAYFSCKPSEGVLEPGERRNVKVA